MKKSEFIKADKKMKNNLWYTNCFGRILLGMRGNGKGEIKNASEVNKILNHLIRDVRKEAQAQEKKRRKQIDTIEDAYLINKFKEHRGHVMRMDMHDDAGTSPCLHCDCGSTWGATERAMSYLITEHNYRISLPS